MPRRRPRALLLLLSLGAFALALGGCGRRVTSIAPEGLVGVESDPASPSATAPDGPPFHFPADAGGDAARQSAAAGRRTRPAD